MKKTLGTVTSKVLPLCLLAAFASPAMAQKAGDNIISFGWMGLKPNDSSEAMKITSHSHNPAAVRTVPDSGASVGNANTLGIAYTRFITDHFSMTVDAGIPPNFKLNGMGSLAGVGQIGSADQLSPAILAKWHFLDSDAKIRPFLGAGVTYVWYSGIKTTENFQSYMSKNLTAGDGGHTDISLGSSFAPVLTAGVSYAFNEKWSLNFSASYIPLKTKAEMTTTRSPAPGTTIVAKSETTLTLNPLVTFLSVGYKF